MDIENQIENIHKELCQASFLIVTMIVKRKFWPAYTERALRHVSNAKTKLEKLNEWAKNPRV